MHKNTVCRGAILLVLVLVLVQGAFAQPPAEPAAEPAAAPRAEPAAETPAASPGESAEPADTGPKTLLGISILGNQETPKSLVIVPWKSSEIGSGIGVSRALDTAIRPVDKDVFMRELEYYEIRSSGAN